MNLSFQNRILFGFGTILFVMVLVAVVVFFGVRSLGKSFEWVDHTHRVLDKASQVTAAAVDMETGMRGFLLAGKDEFLEPYNSGKTRFYDLIDELKVTVSDNPAQVELLSEIDSIISSWDEVIVQHQIETRRGVGFSLDMDDVAALVGEARGKAYFDNFRVKIQEFKDRERLLMVTRMASFRQSEQFVVTSTILGTLIAFIIGIYISVMITKYIMQLLGGQPGYIAKNVALGDMSYQIAQSPSDAVGIYSDMIAMMNSLQEKSKLAESIARGDLQTNIKLASDKDSLGVALREMHGKLNQILGQTQQVAGEITYGSSVVSRSSRELSDGASVQAESIENISSSLHQLSVQITNNADNAKQAQQLTCDARDASNKGMKKMSEMVNAMHRLSQTSDSISTFIKTIDEIAEQTNLLALNAAIEAARAGEQGRGFSVVADEVRKLAARSVAAAEQTSILISNSAEQTKLGSQIANETAESLKLIFERIDDTTHLVGDISRACSEQAVGADEISLGVANIDDVTKRNRETAKNSAASSERLAQQAQSLEGVLSEFILGTA